MTSGESKEILSILKDNYSPKRQAVHKKLLTLMHCLENL